MLPARRPRTGIGPVILLLLLLALAAAAFGSHVVHGGFYSDDWAISELETQRGYWGSVDALFDVLGSKPVLAVLLPVPHALFGSTTELHLALAAVLSVLTSASFYLLLRTLGLEHRHAGPIAALSLLFPWADSTRLWATASINNVAVILYLLGVVTALRGLAHSGHRSVLMHAGAVTLYVLSVLTYELAAVAALASVLLYRYRSSWRRALTRWAADVLAIGAALAYTAATTVKHVAPLDDQVVNAAKMARGAASLVAAAFLPVGDPPRLVVGLALLLLVATAALVVRRGDADDPAVAELRRWLLVAAAAVGGTAAAYAMLVPAASFTPLLPGLENRINLLAAPAIVTLVYALLMIAALLAFRRVRPWRRWSLYAATAATVLLAVGYAVRLADDEDAWEHAAKEQQRVLAVMHEAVPQPPAGGTIYTFGQLGEAGPRVPVFYATWDLTSAARLLWRDFELDAYPAFQRARFACRRRGVLPQRLPTPYGDLDPRDNSADPAVPYGDAVFVDIRTRSHEVIDDRSECLAAIRRFRPGAFRNEG